MAESNAKKDWMKKNTVQGTIKLYRKQDWAAAIIDYFGGKITAPDIRKALEEYIKNHPKPQDPEDDEILRFLEDDEDGPQEFLYGMRSRGCSPGAQPKGFIERRDDPSGKYHDIIVYDHPLTGKECEEYELDHIYPAD